MKTFFSKFISLVCFAFLVFLPVFLTTSKAEAQVSTKFIIGDTVYTTSNLNVRTTGSGSVLGIIAGTIMGVVPVGSQGTITGGPTASGGFNWWNVHYASGINGWSAENYLVKANTTTSAYPSGCTSASGYSSTTGLSCSGTATLLPGCTSVSGYSSTTGEPCSGTSTPIAMPTTSTTPYSTPVLYAPSTTSSTTVTPYTTSSSVDLKVSVSGGSPSDGPLSIGLGAPVTLSWKVLGTTPCYKSSIPASEFTGALTPLNSGSLTSYTPFGGIEYRITCGNFSDKVLVNTSSSTIVSPISLTTPATSVPVTASTSSTSPVASSSTKFSIGDTVQATANLNVRSTPNGTIIGTVPAGTQGTIIEGPLLMSGKVWWKVQYASGISGWSAEDYLQKIVKAGSLLTLNVTYASYLTEEQWQINYKTLLANPGPFSYFQMAVSRGWILDTSFNSYKIYASWTMAGSEAQIRAGLYDFWAFIQKMAGTTQSAALTLANSQATSFGANLQLWINAINQEYSGTISSSGGAIASNPNEVQLTNLEFTGGGVTIKGAQFTKGVTQPALPGGTTSGTLSVTTDVPSTCSYNGGLGYAYVRPQEYPAQYVNTGTMTGTKTTTHTASISGMKTYAVIEENPSDQWQYPWYYFLIQCTADNKSPNNPDGNLAGITIRLSSNDLTPPQLEIVSPAKGATVAQVVPVVYKVTDAINKIKSVTFYKVGFGDPQAAPYGPFPTTNPNEYVVFIDSFWHPSSGSTNFELSVTDIPGNVTKIPVTYNINATDTSFDTKCGNGIVDAGESCDCGTVGNWDHACPTPNLAGKSCTDFTHGVNWFPDATGTTYKFYGWEEHAPFSGGQLKCNRYCAFDVASCIVP